MKVAHAVTGSYDVIAFTETENVSNLGEFIGTQIHRLPGVVKMTRNVGLSRWNTAMISPPSTRRNSAASPAQSSASWHACSGS